MSKKKGLLALALGVAATAAAIFLSKEENREKTKVAVKKAAVQAKAVAKKAKVVATKKVAVVKKKVAAAKKASKK